MVWFLETEKPITKKLRKLFVFFTGQAAYLLKKNWKGSWTVFKFSQKSHTKKVPKINLFSNCSNSYKNVIYFLPNFPKYEKY